MTEPTYTRTELRRALCQVLEMPFYKRTGGQSVIGASPAPTTTSISDTSLVIEDDFWNNQWWYSIKNNEVRKIVDTLKTNTTIKFEYAATLPVAADAYEIHSIFNAFDLHEAINRAIDDSFPAFFDYVTDETLILQENILKYQINGLTSIPWRICQIWVELSESKITGTATAGTAGYLIDSKANFADVKAGWYISVYSGTGAGQLRTVSSVTGTTQINVSTVWTTAPDTTSKYAVWNPNSQTMQWEKVFSASFDAHEYPNYLYFTKAFPSSVGLRIRLEYMARPLPLSLEASTTIIPKEFIIHRALSILFGMKVNDNRADRNRYANLEEYQRQLAEQYRQARAFQPHDITPWEPAKSLLTSSKSEEYPF